MMGKVSAKLGSLNSLQAAETPKWNQRYMVSLFLG